MRRPVSSLVVWLGIAVVLLSHIAVEAVRERKLYDTLSVAPDASEQEIKKAYRKGALCVPPFLGAARSCAAALSSSHQAISIRSACVQQKTA